MPTDDNNRILHAAAEAAILPTPVSMTSRVSNAPSRAITTRTRLACAWRAVFDCLTGHRHQVITELARHLQIQ